MKQLGHIYNYIYIRVGRLLDALSAKGNDKVELVTLALHVTLQYHTKCARILRVNDRMTCKHNTCVHIMHVSILQYITVYYSIL